MKIFKFGNLCLLLSLAALTGCLEREFSEAEGVMSVDTREIVVPGDMSEGQNRVTDTIYVTSNRSWSVAFEEDVDWVKMDTTGHQDMARISEVTPLVFRFKDNFWGVERSVKVKINSADGEKEVTLRQEAIKYRLTLESSTDGFESVKSDGDTLIMIISSNTPDLHIGTKEGSTASLKYKGTDGRVGDTWNYGIKVAVAENEELVTKNAIIVVSSSLIPEEKWLEIPVGQLEGFPYFRFTDSFSKPEATDTTALDGVSGLAFGIKTNSNWKCELVSSEGFGAIQKMAFDAASQTWSAVPGSAAVPGDVIAGGDKTMTSAMVNFPATLAFGTEPKLVVKFTADGVEESRTITIHQKPCVRWWMGVLDDEHMWLNDASLGFLAADVMTYGLSSPGAVSSAGKLPTSSGSRVNIGKEVVFTTTSGVDFRVFTPYGMWMNSKTGIMIGQGQGTMYVEIPAIEGVALKKIVVTYRNTSTMAFDVQTFDGSETVLAGCSLAGQGTQKEFEVPGTKKNTAYRMLSTNTGHFCIGDMIWYYE